MTMRTIRTSFLALAALSAAFGADLGALAQTAGKDGRVADPVTAGAPPAAGTQTAPAKPQQPWVLNCSNQATGDALTCAMTQTIITRETNQRVISATIFRDGQTNALRLQLGLPHGLDLTAGVGLSIDDRERFQSVIKTADQNGSYALVDISEQLLTGMRAGQVLNVAVKSLDGRDVTLQLSLVGFATSIARV